MLDAIGADVEIYDTVRMGQYLPHAARAGRQPRRIVYLDDLFSVRYARMLETMRAHPEVEIAPLGEFQRVMPALLGRVAAHARVQRLLLRLERALVARRERQSVRDFDACLLVSETEVARLSARTRASNVHTLPPVVDPATAPRAVVAPPTFVLLGLLSLPHNHDAALTFLRTCLPDLLRQVPDACVRIIGRGETEELRARSRAHGDRVTIEGFVARPRCGTRRCVCPAWHRCASGPGSRSRCSRPSRTVSPC